MWPFDFQKSIFKVQIWIYTEVRRDVCVRVCVYAKVLNLFFFPRIPNMMWPSDLVWTLVSCTAGFQSTVAIIFKQISIDYLLSARYHAKSRDLNTWSFLFPTLKGDWKLQFYFKYWNELRYKVLWTHRTTHTMSE